MTFSPRLATLADLLGRIANDDRGRFVVQDAASQLVKLAADVIRLVPPSTPVQEIIGPLLRALPVGRATRSDLERLGWKVAAPDAHPWLTGRADRLASTLGKLADKIVLLEARVEGDRRKGPLASLLSDVVSVAFPDKSQDLVQHLIRSDGHRSLEAAVIADLWPDELGEDQEEPAPYLCNRLHQLQCKTNSKLIPLSWKITRPERRVLFLRSLKVE